MKIVYANTSTVVASPNGIPVMVPWGSHWPADDPLVRAHPEMFTEDPSPGLRVTERRSDPIETATANPGEKRVRKA